MPSPLPRLATADSPIGCSSAAQRPSPSGRRVGANKKLSGPAQGSRALRPARLPTGLNPALPEASARRSPDRAAPAATGVYRQLPGRDSHPLVLETLDARFVSLVSSSHELLSCRTASDFLERACLERQSRLPRRLRRPCCRRSKKKALTHSHLRPRSGDLGGVGLQRERRRVREPVEGLDAPAENTSGL